MAFLCSPNNPTGNVTAEEEVRALLESTDAIVFLDEAYVEFAEQSLVSLVKEYDNLVVGRTLSKAFGLAGMRLGYAVAPQWIADQYKRAAPPFFGITCASVAAGVAALSDVAFMHQFRGKDSSRSGSGCKRRLNRIPLRPTSFTSRRMKPPMLFVEKFLARGIIIRDCRSFRGAGEHHVRVTVGTPAENDRFLSAFQEICR